ncbi:MAG: crotonase/enoyl-CoA hydratase family protein [Myxococcota bacterium]
MSSAVSYEKAGDVALVTMDDGKANALSHALLDALTEALDRAETEAKALVLAGRRGRFCAGFDLKTMMAGPDSLTGLMTQGGEFFLRLYTFPVPVVAASTGHALAGGALLLLSCDLRIGADGPFKVGLNETQIGLPLPLLGRELARDRLSPRHLQAATTLAQIYDPQAAVDVGYLDRIVTADALLDTARDEAARLAGSLSQKAFAATKLRLREATVKTIRDGFQPDLAALAALAPTS